MICKNCSNEVPEGVKFCPYCGANTEVSEAATQTAEAPAYAPVPDGSYQPEYYAAPPAPQKPKLNKKLLLSIVAVVLVLAIAITTFIIIPRAGTPKHMNSALRNTLEKDSFTVTIDMGDDSTYTLAADLKNSQFSMESTYTTYDDEKVTNIMAYSDGIAYQCREEDGEVSGEKNDIADHEDIVKAQADILKVLTNMTKGKGTALSDLGYGEDIIDALDAIPSLVGDYVDIEINEEDINWVISEIASLLNDKAWLEEFAGFEHSKEGKSHVYTFTPDTYEIVKELISIFSERILGDFADTIDTALSAYKSTINSVKITATVTVTNNLVEKIELEVEDAGSITIEFSDYNKTKVDIDKIADMAD